MGKVPNSRFPVSEIERICAKYGVDQLYVFGSFARGEETPKSDVDLLVRFVRPVSFFTLLDMEEALSELFGRPVDLVTERALSPYFRPHALKEAKLLYERSKIRKGHRIPAAYP